MAKENIKSGADENQPGTDPQASNLVALDRETVNKLLETINNQLASSSRIGQVNFRSSATTTKEEDELKSDQDGKLNKTEAITVAFPPCSDVMLSLIKCKKYIQSKTKQEWIAPISEEEDLVTKMFLEYFGFNITGASIFEKLEINQIISGTDFLDEGWNKLFINKNWPPTWCLPASYVTLKGQRHFYSNPDENKDYYTVKSLFLADAVWLFYMERMGLFQILGKILDEYAYNGGFPISNGSVIDGPKDDLLALVLEAMTRQMEMGTASKVRDRTALYRTALGWTLDNGRKLSMETNVNTAFNNQFHKFIYLVLQYYKDKRIKDAIQASTSNSPNSGATMVSIRSTMNLLKKSFDNFHYGRNYYNTLSGIVWAVAAFAVIRDIRETIGIPTQYDEPYDYIPEMYERLVSKSPSKSSDVNRFETHYECATNARDILIDIELLDTSATNAKDQDIETWLSIIETKVEGYRSAYRALTGVDLGTTMVSTQEPVIEQQV